MMEIEPYYDKDGITIYNGDCLEIMKQFEDKSFDLVLTDPPYGVKKGNEEWDNEYPSGFEKECLRVGKTCAIMCGVHNIPKCIENVGNEYLSIIALDNRNGMALSPLGFSNWIPVIIAGKKPKMGRDLISFVVKGKKPNHPSPKPIDAMIKLVQRLTTKYDSILDPFMGSGTTLVAAKKLGRRAVGIEISEEYCKIAVKRLAQEVLPLYD